MKTLLELIESRKPCRSYKIYLFNGHLTTQTTIKDILFSKYIENEDKDWFFEMLFSHTKHRPWVSVTPEEVKVTHFHNQQTNEYDYDHDTFIAMVYEYLEHVDLDAAI